MITTKLGDPTRCKRALVLVSAAAVTASAILGVQAARWMSYAAKYDDDAGVVMHHRLGPNQVNPEWIISGRPQFRIAVFNVAAGSNTVNGIWECIGPAKFRWQYGVDEVIYILDGSAEIEYLGKKLTLVTGDSVKFTSGTTAVWTVPDHVKKTFSIHSAGRMERLIRRVVD